MRPHSRRVAVRTTQLSGGLAGSAALAAAAQFVPSVVSLGQWSPLTAVAGWCRWRCPDPGTVALTFDDGPSPEHTPAILDDLDRLGLRATFFCLGREVVAHPGLVREIRRRGHAVGSHGFSHAHHLFRSPAWIRRDLEAAEAALAGEGVAVRWFRPPFGQTPGPTLLEAHRRWAGITLWSAWGREWVAADGAAVVRQVLRGLQGGAIVLLHDSDRYSPPGTVDRVRAALGPLAAAIQRLDLRPVTLDEVGEAA